MAAGELVPCGHPQHPLRSGAGWSDLASEIRVIRPFLLT